MKNFSSKKWILIFVFLFVVSLGSFMLIKYFGRAGTIADIYVDSELYQKIDLSAVVKPYDIKIETDEGYNIVHVEHDGISVIEADCRDHVCINQGVISDDGVPIVCLPHRLVIEIEGDTVDG